MEFKTPVTRWISSASMLCLKKSTFTVGNLFEITSIIQYRIKDIFRN